MKKIDSAELEQKIAIAKDRSSTSMDLEPLFGISGKLDLVLAGHVNSPPDQLRGLARTGSEPVQRRLIWNPSMPSGEDYAFIANIFPETFISKMSARHLLEERPDRLEGLTSIIELADCPDEILRHLATTGSVRQRELIYELRSETLANLTKITGAAIHERRLKSALQCAEAMIFDDLDERVREKIKNYLRISRAYAIPKYSAQDRSSRHQRCANLLGGVPFTSQKYPWPLTDEVGLPMQPVLQIDLGDASAHLHESFGDGLLQVWGRTDHSGSALSQSEMDRWVLLRHIPAACLLDTLTDDFPSSAPWESEDSSPDEDGPQAIFLDGPEEMKRGSVISWRNMGAMWQFRGELDLESDFDDWHLREQIADELQSSIVCPSNTPEIYIGGFGGQAGGFEDPTLGTRIVVRADFGGGMHLGIFMANEKSDAPKFGWVIRYH